MKLTYISPVFIFECEIAEKDIPKKAGFKFNRFATKKWATDDVQTAGRLIQYADDLAKSAFSAVGVNIDRAIKSALAREKRDLPEFKASISRKRMAEIEQWMGFVEQKAETGYFYQSGHEALRKLQAADIPEIKTRIDAAIERAKTVAQSAREQRDRQILEGRAERALEWIDEHLKGGSWYQNGETRTREAAAAMRLISEDAADSFLARLAALRGAFDKQAAQRTKTLPLVTSDRTGGGEFRVGQLLRNHDIRIDGGEPTWLVVTDVSKKYYSQEMADDFDCRPGWEFYAECRTAKPEEYALAAAGYEEFQAYGEIVKAHKATVRAGEKELAEIFHSIQKEGMSLPGVHFPSGERIILPATRQTELCGGGRWFVINEDEIWTVQSNGMAGDDWSRNNVHTGGAGAIGHKIEMAPEIVVRIRKAKAAVDTPGPKEPQSDAFKAYLDARLR
jgi:hypothetical protein